VKLVGRLKGEHDKIVCINTLFFPLHDNSRLPNVVTDCPGRYMKLLITHSQTSIPLDVFCRHIYVDSFELAPFGTVIGYPNCIFKTPYDIIDFLRKKVFTFTQTPEPAVKFEALDDCWFLWFFHKAWVRSVNIKQNFIFKKNT